MLSHTFLKLLKRLLFFTGLFLVAYGEYLLMVPQGMRHDVDRVQVRVGTAVTHIGYGGLAVLASAFIKKR